MNVSTLFGRLLGLEQAEAIERVEPSLAAPWAREAPAWLVFGGIVLAALAIAVYARYQPARQQRAKWALAAVRASLLVLLLVFLAEPVLTVRMVNRLRPALWLLVDGSESMSISDDLPESDRLRLAAAAGLGQASPERAAGMPSRMEYLKAVLQRPDRNVLRRLEERFRVRAFLFDRADGVRGLELSGGNDGRIDPAHIASQLTTVGDVTALGAAIEDLGRRQNTSNVAGLVVLSDFNQNSGLSPLDAARRLGMCVYTVGIGPVAALDLAVDLQVPPLLKKDERSSLTATIRQEGLAGQSVTVRFVSQELAAADSDAPAIEIGQRTIDLHDAVETIEMPYVPATTGRYVLSAEIDAIEGEVVAENNRASRETTVRDDYLRLLYVEYEPAWEWRFVKEVFHRDKLVGQRGFRTFLRSADPRVRAANELFLTTLTPPRSEFFAHDVIILGDMPASALSPGFCRMTREYVDQFGGGLVVVAGSRYGPGELASTPLGELLPVKVDPHARRRDRQPFEIERTADAAQYDFMQLGASDAENAKAWRNLGPLAWYQPVEHLRPLATALAVHPTDKCADGQQPQPIIAAQYYGRGEVVYIGFNELWRLRKKYGEQYYRQFWGQLIHRLALRHALGSQKRFVVRTDRKQYRADDHVLVTVEAYDADFRPLGEEMLPDGKLDAELILPPRNSIDESGVRPLAVSQLRKGIYEARVPVFAGGEHRIRVRDPITGEPVETSFRVVSTSIERQRAVRDTALAESLASATGGRSYDLTTLERLPDEIGASARTETNVEVVPLWNTWLAFVAVVGLMLGEWFGRKRVNLP